MLLTGQLAEQLSVVKVGRNAARGTRTDLGEMSVPTGVLGEGNLALRIVWDVNFTPSGVQIWWIRVPVVNWCYESEWLLLDYVYCFSINGSDNGLPAQKCSGDFREYVRNTNTFSNLLWKTAHCIAHLSSLCLPIWPLFLVIYYVYGFLSYPTIMSDIQQHEIFICTCTCTCIDLLYFNAGTIYDKL